MNFKSSFFYLKIISYIKATRFYFGNIIRFLNRKKFQKSISPSDAVTIFGESFSKYGNHFIIKFLNEYSNNNNIDILNSSLSRFHQEFCPKTTEEALGVQLEGNGLSIFSYPWGKFGNNKTSTKKDPKNSRFCGPSSEQFIINEGKSIIELFKKISKNGYRPTKFPYSFIQGVWMINKDKKKKFVVLQGNHRMAILSYLGFNKIQVRCDQFKVPKILEKDIEKWSEVASGKVPKYKAKEIFDKFFN